MPPKASKKKVSKAVAQAKESERKMEAAERVAKEWLDDSGIGDYCEVDGSMMIDDEIIVTVAMRIPDIDIELALKKNETP